MKKLILCLGIIALLTGCGKEEKMMTCTNETTTNGLTSGTEYLVTYTDDEVSHVRITYNYNQDTHTDGVGTGTDGTTEDGKEDNTTDDEDKTDGVIENNNEDNNEIVDGIVGDTADMLIGGMYNTILDISGLKDRHTNDMNTTNIEGFTSSVEDNTNSSYKVVYNLDLTKISDEDINRFNVDRSYQTLRDNYTNQGLTCK